MISFKNVQKDGGTGGGGGVDKIWPFDDFWEFEAESSVNNNDPVLGDTDTGAGDQQCERTMTLSVIRNGANL